VAHGEHEGTVEHNDNSCDAEQALHAIHLLSFRGDIRLIRLGECCGEPKEPRQVDGTQSGGEGARRAGGSSQSQSRLTRGRRHPLHFI
jgi:hypothetical protein